MKILNTNGNGTFVIVNDGNVDEESNLQLNIDSFLVLLEFEEWIDILHD